MKYLDSLQNGKARRSVTTVCKTDAPSFSIIDKENAGLAFVLDEDQYFAGRGRKAAVLGEGDC